MSVPDYIKKAEDFLDTISTPIQPYLPVIARTLLVATFLEDTLRMVTQWEDQVWYLTHSRAFPWLMAELFLVFNMLSMVIGSGLAIAKKHTEVGCGALGVSVLIQTIGYGLFFNLSVMFRNLSILGGLMILLADSYMTTKKRNFVFAGIPSMNEDEKTMYLMLLGRIFLVGLLFSFIMNGEFTVLRACVIFLSFISCVLVIVGFKAKSSAWVLIALMGIGNLVLNNFWSLHHNDHNRDFIQYDFFQVLSIMGGFLLFAQTGPGGLSYDEKKKDF